MRALITGSNGFVGSHWVAELVKHGHEVFSRLRRTSVAGVEDIARALILAAESPQIATAREHGGK